jgi:hypothetical protein
MGWPGATGVDAHAENARAMSSEEIIPTGNPVSGETTT